MLSSLANRTGSFGVLVRSLKPHRVLVIAQNSTGPPAPTPDSKPKAAAPVASSSEDNLPAHERWAQINQVFYGPERDMKNFPPVKKQPPGKVRMSFIPEEYFQWLYPKTGVTGPYLFLGGLSAYLFSKEILVIDHTFAHFVGFVGAVWYLNRKVSPFLSKYFDERIEKYEERIYHNPIKAAKRQFEVTVQNNDKEIWRHDGQQYLFEAKRENVALQLEAEHRQRLKTVHDAVKQRLDYQLDMETTRRRLEQEHMVNWISSSVIKSITPQQEKESIVNCIKNLKQLSSAAV